MSGPVQNLVARLDAKRCGEGWIAICPAHDDHKPSLSIGEGADGRALVKCRAGCTLDAVLSAVGLTMKDLFPQSTHRVSGNGQTPRFDWDECVTCFGDKHIAHLMEWRLYSREFCEWLRDNKLIGIHDGLFALPVHDAKGHTVGAHARAKDGENWFYFPKGVKVRPLVIGELQPGDTVYVFESQWDAFAFMDVSGERHGIIITRGASNGALVADVIPQGAKVYLWPQNDAPGEKLANDVCANTKTTVKRIKIPAPHKDLNDWIRAGATCDDLLQAMESAETLREAEKSWADALEDSIVTSSELHGLELTPRKKLLGDWFAEGDCGFIFAFRGVGKTWFALAIAQALSTGGKLGNWQAPAPVKVLYVDGEMPADLIRARCSGLEANNDHLEFLNHEILFDRTGKALNITDPEVQQAVTDRCVKSGVKVLILDNLSTLASGMKENEADSWEKVNNWLLGLRRRKIAVVIVHHAGRSGELRGTSRREDNVFWIIALDDRKKHADDKRGARFISNFTKPSRNTQEEIPAFEWHLVTDSTGVVSIGHKQAQTLDVFRSIVDAGVTECDQIAAEMKVPKYTVSRLAKKAMDEGWLRKRGRNYELVKPGDGRENNGQKKAKK
jgi:putative DNA primase/helicase